MLRYFLRSLKPKGVNKDFNTIRFFRGTLASNGIDSTKVHVTFGESKRVINFPKEEDLKVKGLRHHFLRSFTDVLSEDVALSNVKFQRYDDTFQDYIDLENDAKLEEHAKIKAFIASKHTEKESCFSGDDNNHCIFHTHLHIPWYLVVKEGQTEPSDFKFHPLKKDVPYRLWNTVSNGLIQRNPSNPMVIRSSGAFGDNNTVIEAKSFGQNLFYLVYSDPVDGYLYITAQGENQEIILTPTQSNEALFEPNYYWGHTVFRSKPWNNLYLGTDVNGLATLVPMEDSHYPNPQALFIVNKYIVILQTPIIS